MQKLTIFTTGGTIDKVYFDKNSEYEVGSPTIEKLLAKYNVYFHYDIQTLFHKDSLDLTDIDREEIIRRVRDCADKRCLVTHGTDTMAITARALANANIEGKVIVLTGAILPASFKETDAEFNIGTAFGALFSAQPGVYIAMNGFIYPWDNVYKDHLAQQFKELRPGGR